MLWVFVFRKVFWGACKGRIGGRIFVTMLFWSYSFNAIVCELYVADELEGGEIKIYAECLLVLSDNI